MDTFTLHFRQQTQLGVWKYYQKDLAGAPLSGTFFAVENVPDKGAPDKSEVPCDLNSDLAGAPLSGTFFRGGKVPDKGACPKCHTS